MKRIRASFIVLAGLVLALTIATTPAQAGSYTVSKEDYRGLSYIGRKLGVDWKEIAKTNGIKPPYRIRVGQVLTVPEGAGQPAVVQPETATPAKAPVATAETPASPAGARQWKKVGGDPLLPLRMRKDWHRSEELRLTSEQADRLAQFGLSESQIEQVRKDLAVGKCQATARPVGYIWAGMAMGRGNWTATQNATGDDILVWACPASDGKQVDIAMGCGNVAWNPVQSVPVPAVQTPQEKEAGLACEAVGANWVEMGKNGEGFSSRWTCLFPVSKQWKLGPTVGVKGSRFANGEWVEVSNFLGAGFELRGKNVAGLDALELVVMVGTGSSRGYSTDGLVDKIKASGLDAKIEAQARKRFGLSDEVGVTVRFMPFASLPLTGNHAEIDWKGVKVDDFNSRSTILGAILRLEFDSKGLGFKPEVTLGGWHILHQGDGGKFLVGASTLDGVWRVGVGFHFPHPSWVVEAEWNPALGWLHANTQSANKALVDGATPTEQYLGVKANKAKASNPAKVETYQVKAGAESTDETSNPFAELQFHQMSTGSGSTSDSTLTGSSGLNAGELGYLSFSAGS